MCRTLHLPELLPCLLEGGPRFAQAIVGLWFLVSVVPSWVLPNFGCGSAPFQAHDKEAQNALDPLPLFSTHRPEPFFQRNGASQQISVSPVHRLF
jgi:hypothetical protein